MMKILKIYACLILYTKMCGDTCLTLLQEHQTVKGKGEIKIN